MNIYVYSSEQQEEVMDKIQKIEIYYNPETTVLESNLQKAKTYNLITKKEV